MKELPVRKKIRLDGYDYSSAGYYFVTICVKDRHEILGRVGSGFHARPQVELTDIGLEIQKSIEYVSADTQTIEIPKYIIMPNHVHLIVVLKTVGHGSPTLQSVVGRIKSYTAKRWSEMCGEKYQTFWQSRFHDRIIRNEEEYRVRWQYIDNNPAKWAEDDYFVKK
jgi:REP element-mobilizing transposase RayT